LVATNPSAGVVIIKIEGFSAVPVSKTMTNANNVWNYQWQHNLFGTSQSIDVLMQKTPNLSVRPVSGKVANDYVTWNLYGQKVFVDQVPQLVDVVIDQSSFTAPKATWL